MSELPRGWAKANLFDIVDLHDSRRIPLNQKERAARRGPFPYYGANGQVDSIDDYLFDGEYLLLAEDGGYFDDRTKGVAYEVSGKFWVNNHAHILSAKSEIPLRFLTYKLNSFDWMPYVGGSTRLKLTQEGMRRVEISLPPVAEQRRIVTKLDSLFARTRKAREELARIPILIEHYKQAILAAAFRGDLTADWRKDQDYPDFVAKLLGRAGIEPLDDPSLPTIPNTWAWVTAGEFCEIKSGITLGKKRKPDDELIELPYLRVANVQRGWLDLSEIKTIRVTPKEAEALYLRPGDILMNEGGDRDKLGRGWIWSGELQDCIHQNHVFRLRPYIDIVPSSYISYYANEFGQPYFLSQGKQTTNLASISKTKLSGLPLPIAPPQEAALIVERIEKALASLSVIQRESKMAAKHLDHLDQAALSKAFRGELVTQDLNDEPAEKLLERIRAESHLRSNHRGRHQKSLMQA